MTVDDQYITYRKLGFCEIRSKSGTTICFLNGKCSNCEWAKKYETEIIISQSQKNFDDINDLLEIVKKTIKNRESYSKRDPRGPN